jgi:endoglucanase
MTVISRPKMIYFSLTLTSDRQHLGTNCPSSCDRHPPSRSNFPNDPASRQRVSTTDILLECYVNNHSYTSAGTYISDGSAAALAAVKNPDGTTTNLIFDVHKYLDSNNSGGGADCVTNNIANAFQPLATWLNSIGRQAMLTETGGPSTSNCATYMCQQIAFLK